MYLCMCCIHRRPSSRAISTCSESRKLKKKSPPMATFVSVAIFLAVVAATAVVAQGTKDGGGAGKCEGRYMVVMGASMVDVGENAATMPGRSAAELPPYGVRRFGKPASRFSDGFLLIDFISKGLGYEILDPFLKSVLPNFTHGVNFASSGSTARNTTLKGNGSDSSGLFSLDVQIDQYRSFKAKVLNAQSRHHSRYLTSIPNALKLSKVVHFIETAHNDYISTLLESVDFDPLSLVHSVISAMELNIRELYSLGAHSIIVMNLIPLGCTPGFLAFSTSDPNATFDRDGCVASVNSIVNLHNTHLQELVSMLQTELPLKNIVVFDANSIYIDAIRHPSKYGVKYPFRSCCGAGGEYNVIFGIPCGARGILNGKVLEAKSCGDPSKYISWDGLHPVETFARHLANGVLSGKYLKPNIPIKDICKT